MKRSRLQVRTGSSPSIADLTDDVEAFVRGEGDGLVSISVPHATAGLVVMELGSGSEDDLWARLDALLPRDNSYVHRHGSPGHGADHLLPAFLAPALTLPVFDGRVSLGTWQRIALVDGNVDNPRREVILAFLSDGAGAP
ncbi:MAG TPA: secondary thiamine-phosphate synthase enzyme YjbQ [Actinomycetota bacterium]|nr:secondary thiamine-phosphate synthase enzyme YjbQ [Actinomycetota bacterium]